MMKVWDINIDTDFCGILLDKKSHQGKMKII